MAEARIPVDVFNPGQVFACLGFLEAADLLLGDTMGGFDWDSEGNEFVMTTKKAKNPFAEVLEYLSKVKLRVVIPNGKTYDKDMDDYIYNERFPSFPPEKMSALPIEMYAPGYPVVRLAHWADGSSRNNFKLYSGNRTALKIAKDMLFGGPNTPMSGILQLWRDKRKELVADPFGLVVPMGGSFNFDPRGAWTAMDTGFSLDQQNFKVLASPVVEILAAWGLENARPMEFAPYKVRYAIWKTLVPPVLARPALAGNIPALETRKFSFDLALSGKNKIVQFSEEEFSNDLNS